VSRLRELVKRYAFQKEFPDTQSVTIDNTNRSSRETAEIIASRIDLPSGEFRESKRE